VYPGMGSSVDTLNIMSYDMDPGMKLNFEKILYNYHTFGKVPKMKLNIGFEPGEQGGGGNWEGPERDLKAVDYVNENGFGGAMIWGVNPDKKDTPHSYEITPEFVKNVTEKLTYPPWPWGKAPIYTPLVPPPPPRCHSISPVVTNAWCETNCNAVPPNCPPQYCKCKPKSD